MPKPKNMKRPKFNGFYYLNFLIIGILIIFRIIDLTLTYALINDSRVTETIAWSSWMLENIPEYLLYTFNILLLSLFFIVNYNIRKNNKPIYLVVFFILLIIFSCYLVYPIQNNLNVLNLVNGG